MCPINFRWEETYTPMPTTLPRSRSPHNVLHSPSYMLGILIRIPTSSSSFASTIHVTRSACADPCDISYRQAMACNDHISSQGVPKHPRGELQQARIWGGGIGAHDPPQKLETESFGGFTHSTVSKSWKRGIT